MKTKYETRTTLKDLAPAKKGNAAKLAELTDAELTLAVGGFQCSGGTSTGGGFGHDDCDE